MGEGLEADAIEDLVRIDGDLFSPPPYKRSEKRHSYRFLFDLGNNRLDFK